MTQGMVEVEESDFGGYTRPLDAHVLLAGESASLPMSKTLHMLWDPGSHLSEQIHHRGVSP